jgi:hypothetical protein
MAAVRIVGYVEPMTTSQLWQQKAEAARTKAAELRELGWNFMAGCQDRAAESADANAKKAAAKEAKAKQDA